MGRGAHGGGGGCGGGGGGGGFGVGGGGGALSEINERIRIELIVSEMKRKKEAEEKNRKLETQGQPSFLIVHVKSNRVMTIKNAIGMPGVKVVVAKQCRLDQGRFHQLWYMDQEHGGVIRSKLNDLALQVTEDRKKVQVMTFADVEPRQRWTLDTDFRMYNTSFVDECLDVQHGCLFGDHDVRGFRIDKSKPSPWRLIHV